MLGQRVPELFDVDDEGKSSGTRLEVVPAGWEERAERKWWPTVRSMPSQLSSDWTLALSRAGLASGRLLRTNRPRTS